MAYKCDNPSCVYGPEWDQGLPVTRDANGCVKPHLRADAYSQHECYRQNGNKPFDGYCLNCLDDARRWDEDAP